jgi:hypothetical protein
MQILEALRVAWHLVSGGEVDEPWANDEQAFEEHFGRSYEEFERLIGALDQANSQLYEKTLEVNPEAAVTWVFFLAG